MLPTHRQADFLGPTFYVTASGTYTPLSVSVVGACLACVGLLLLLMSAQWMRVSCKGSCKRSASIN